MPHPDEHWEQVAKYYKEAKVEPKELTGGKTEDTVRAEKVQNRYPHVTYGTVRVWIKKCRNLGLI